MSIVSISLSSSPLSSFAVLSSSSEETVSSLSGFGFVDVVVCTANWENCSVASSRLVYRFCSLLVLLERSFVFCSAVTVPGHVAGLAAFSTVAVERFS